MNMVNTQLVGCDEQELVNELNIAKNLEESIAILLLNIIGRYDLNLLTHGILWIHTSASER